MKIKVFESGDCKHCFYELSLISIFHRTPTLESVLDDYIATNIIMAEDMCDMQRIPVCRDSIWPNTMRCLENPTFVFNCGLNVVFVDEGAVDCGGPTR